MEGGLAALDDIARERQRIVARLARLDEERAKLSQELAELDAAERVLRRLGRASAAAPNGAAERAVVRRRPPPMTKLPPLGDATLRAVEALGGGVSAAEIRLYLEREFGMLVRPNHLGMALQRHRRAGRLEQHDTRWSVPRMAVGSRA
jgi:hypothetical protein